MKRVLMVVALVVVAAILGMWRTQGGVRRGLNQLIGASAEETNATVNDEIKKSFTLKPGTRVEVSGINGRVQIQTANISTAEVVVVRTAANSESLRRREIIVEQTADGLSVHGRQNHFGFWQHLFGRDPKEDVTINAPRQIALSLKGINGNVSAGEIDGTLEVKGVNGGVSLEQARESAELTGVNGNISLQLKELGERGARFSGINGNIELRLTGGLNADLVARGMNGQVRSEISDVTVEKEEHGSRYTAKIGTGGSPISISGINGNVLLKRSENQSEPPASSQNRLRQRAGD